jgi:hypothetical protein
MAKINQTEQALSLFIKGQFKEALKIFKTFHHGFSSDECRAIQIAYECYCGRSAFFSSLGIDTDKMLVKAFSIIKEKYKL